MAPEITSLSLAYADKINRGEVPSFKFANAQAFFEAMKRWGIPKDIIEHTQDPEQFLLKISGVEPDNQCLARADRNTREVLLTTEGSVILEALCRGLDPNQIPSEPGLAYNNNHPSLDPDRPHADLFVPQFHLDSEKMHPYYGQNPILSSIHVKVSKGALKIIQNTADSIPRKHPAPITSQTGPDEHGFYQLTLSGCAWHAPVGAETITLAMRYADIDWDTTTHATDNTERQIIVLPREDVHSMDDAWWQRNGVQWLNPDFLNHPEGGRLAQTFLAVGPLEDDPDTDLDELIEAGIDLKKLREGFRSWLTQNIQTLKR